MSEIYTGDYDENYVKVNFPEFEKELLSAELQAELNKLGYKFDGKSTLQICQAIFVEEKRRYVPEECPALDTFRRKWNHYIPYYLFFNTKDEKKMTIKVTNHVGDDVCIVHIPFSALYDASYYAQIAETNFFYPFLFRPNVVNGILQGDKFFIDKVNYFLTYSSKGATEGLLKMIRDSKPEYYKALVSKCEVMSLED